MTHSEANNIINHFYTSDTHTEEDKFLFEEAQHILIDTYHNPNDMHNLAWHYAEERRFDLYQRYLEIAAEYCFHPAYEGLGYVWYYGQNGKVDYKKAYEYFSKGAECEDDYLRSGCEMKLADMYHNGYYVEKNEAKYKEIIEKLYDELQHPERMRTIIPAEFQADPSISYRLAGIRAEEGRLDEAKQLLHEARIQYAESLKSNPYWWGNVEEMENTVFLMHNLFPEKSEEIDLYDLFWIAKKECMVVFEYRNRRFMIECIFEEENIVIRFDYKWYRNVRSFFEKAKIGDRHITTLYDEIYDLVVHYG
jgi:tetratricopeptide (TPR) repeat protein